MGNVAMHAAADRSRRQHYLVQAHGNFAGGNRPYWECSCYAGRYLPELRNGPETDEEGAARARKSHARHAKNALLDEERSLRKFTGKSSD